MFTAHFSWMDFRFLPSFFLVFVSFFPSLCVSVSVWWGEWSWSGGWGAGAGWGEVSSWAGMTRLVRCMCVSVCFSVCDATVAQRSCSFRIFRWLLHIIHSSQLLFQALWVAELSSRSWVCVKRQWFPTFFGLWALTMKDCLLTTPHHELHMC